MARRTPRLWICVEQLDGPVDILHHHALGDLELKQLRGIRSSAARRRCPAADFRRGTGAATVDRHRDGGKPCAARPYFARTRSEHPAPDRNDQPGFLGEGNELHRRQVAEFRVSPAQQRLDAVDPASRNVELRLIVQRELIELERVTQTGFEHQPLDRLRLDLRREEAEVVLAFFLGKIHRHVGVLGQRFARRRHCPGRSQCRCCRWCGTHVRQESSPASGSRESCARRCST